MHSISSPSYACAMAVNFINFCLTTCLCCSLFGRCHSFNPKKRRIGPQNYAIYFSRGGGINDGYTDTDDTFSQFIESFESELSKIRRDAEIETEIEMQKLLGLVDNSRTTYEEVERDEYDDEQEVIPQYDEIEGAVERDETEEEDEVQYPEIDQLKEKPEDTTDQRKDDSYLRSNELDSPDLPDDEEDIYDLDERTLPDKVDTLVTGDTIRINTEDATRSQGDDEIVDVDNEELAVNNATLQAAIDGLPEDGATILLPKSEHKKQRKSKSKKRKAAKSIKRHIGTDNSTPAKDEVMYSNGHELSTISITKENDIQTSKKGLQFYLQSDLVRAVLLFLATVAVSIWLQRVQQQMEAQGI